MNRATLEKPFPQSVVKTRKGSFGQVSYVEAAHYIRRLNEAFNGDWSWRIIAHELRDANVIVHGELLVGGVSRHAFGGGPLTYNKTTGEIVSVADDLKAAATDALKKACSMLGMGLELYGASEPKNAPQPVPTPPARPSRISQPAAAPAQPPTAPEQPIQLDEYRLTAKQLRAIWAIATKVGISDAELKTRCKAEFGCMPDYLTKRQASGFIELLSAAQE